MTRNEIVQWTVVGIIVLGALLWTALRIANIRRKRDGGCSCCESAHTCKARELKEAAQCRKKETAKDH